MKPSCSGWSLPSCSSPSTVMRLLPFACTANIVHDFTGRPSSSTVHAPQWVVSHPMCVPVSRSTSRMRWTSRSRGSTSASCFSPLIESCTRMTYLRLSARSAALRSARPVSTRTRSFLYATEPRRSAAGSEAAEASRAACAIVASSSRLPRSEVAADRREVPHQRVGDHLARVVEQRIARANDLRLFQLGFPRQRADGEDAVGLADVRETGDAVDVHDVRRAREAQLHQRDEALPSGEDLGLLAESREQRRGVVERCGGVILERGWNHGGHPFRWSEPKGPVRGRNRTGSPWACQGPRV